MAKKSSTIKTDKDRLMETLYAIGHDIGDINYALNVITSIQAKEQFKLESMQLLATAAIELLIEKGFLTEDEVKGKVVSLTKLLQKEKKKQMKKYKEKSKEAFEKSLMDSENVGHA